MNECSSTIIYINYLIVVSISQQTNFITFNTNKLNFRFIRAFQYFFDFNLQIKHKIDKFNIVLNVFFRFQTNVTTTKKIDVFEAFYDSLIDLCNDDLITKKSIFLTYYIILIEITNDFKNKFKKIYTNELYWIKILIIIKLNNDDTSLIVALKQTFVVISKQTFVIVSKITNVVLKTAIVVSQTLIVVLTSLTNNKTINFRFDLRFKYRNDLIYFIIKDNRECFCISTSLK